MSDQTDPAVRNGLDGRLVVIVLLVGGTLLALIAYLGALVPPSATGLPFPRPTWNARETALDVPADDPDELNTLWSALPNGGGEVEITPLGKLVLTTGRILATDLNFIDCEPFRRTVAPGNYAVCNGWSGAFSFAAVILRPDVPPTRWVAADAFGESAALLADPQGAWGVGLDSSGIVVDADVCRRQLPFDSGKLMEDDDTGVVLDPASGLNVVRIELGGSGVHRAYWGLDENDTPVGLLFVGQH